MNITGDHDAVMGMERRFFGWLDYSVFVLMLAVSAAIGVFFGCFGNKQKKAVDYLLGGKTMTVFPVAVSLVASFISGITMMGVPSEVYIHGFNYWYCVVGAVMTGVLINYVFLPVFFGLQLTSTYEYLERRFDQKIRRMASMLSTINILLYIPIVVYVPALAFSSVSGLSVHVISPAVCIICIFYTMLGGLKAVIWTDFVQGFLILGSCLVVIVLGVVQLGGLAVIFERSIEGRRLTMPDFDPSPFNRDTIWTATIGSAFTWAANSGVSQGFVVKYLSLPTLQKARRALLILVLGIILMKTISVFTGLLIYATYYDCDPVSTEAIQRADQILPYYVMDTAASIPGLPGIFIAGIFSAALSTLSSSLNSLSGTIFEDFIKPMLKKGQLSEKRVNLVLRSIVVVAGALCVLLVFVVEQLGTVLQLGLSVGAITNGALLGLFSLGVFFPWVNSKGALVGSITSMMTVGWLVTGAQLSIKNGSILKKELPASIEGCVLNGTVLNDTITHVFEEPLEPPFVLYRISFYYFSVLGTVIVIVVGLAVSYFTEQIDPANLEVALFAPFLQPYIQRLKDEAVRPAEKELLNKDGAIEDKNNVTSFRTVTTTETILATD